MTTAWLDEAALQEPVPPGRSRGPLGWLLLALWLPLVLIAAAAPVVGPFMLARQDVPADRDSAYERVGLFVTVLNIKPFSEEAIASGFRAGDTVITVDGQPLAGNGTAVATEELTRRIAGPDGTSVVVGTRSADGSLRRHRLTRSGAHIESFARAAGWSRSGMGAFAGFANILASGLIVIAAVLLFAKAGRRPVALLLSFTLLILGMSFAGLALAIALQLGWLILPARVLGWSLFMLALMLFPNGRYYPHWLRAAGWLLIAATPVGVVGLATDTLPLVVWMPLHTAFLAVGIASLIARYRSLDPGTERQQIRWALFGFALGAAFLFAVLIDEFFVQPRDLRPRDMALSIVFDVALQRVMMIALAGGLLVSLLRFRLFDADRVIARSASFGALAVVLVALFAGTEKVIELIGEEVLGEELGVLAGGIGAAVAAAMIVPLHHRLTHWAEHKFQKQLIQLRQGLPALVGDLRETASVERIAAASLDWIARGVHASRAALVVGGAVTGARGIAADEVADWQMGWVPAPDSGLDIARSDALFPLRVPLEADGHGRVGWLLLGPRPDGSFYGKDERATLAAIADPVARALEIAQAREAREAAERERWRGQDRLNAEIKAVNAELVRVLGTLDAKLTQLVPAPAKPAAKRRAKPRAATRRTSGRSRPAAAE